MTHHIFSNNLCTLGCHSNLSCGVMVIISVTRVECMMLLRSHLRFVRGGGVLNWTKWLLAASLCLGPTYLCLQTLGNEGSWCRHCPSSLFQIKLLLILLQYWASRLQLSSDREKAWGDIYLLSERSRHTSQGTIQSLLGISTWLETNFSNWYYLSHCCPVSTEHGPIIVIIISFVFKSLISIVMMMTRPGYNVTSL